MTAVHTARYIYRTYVRMYLRFIMCIVQVPVRTVQCTLYTYLVNNKSAYSGTHFAVPTTLYSYLLQIRCFDTSDTYTYMYYIARRE